eukprot:CAMPEP_0119036794 /NCGR_PEP_ID=MMETSP1177-20130426/4749_1 /TAXON_ID=2985 /ORGANISM="Ochromonas sp, Strain CCMP1899" /LENGTH=368 /DNA_ID=CAMNT_0006997163 /DNA_START=89 /DNA_END=1192 /DNA_ORIENTATION=+
MKQSMASQIFDDENDTIDPELEGEAEVLSPTDFNSVFSKLVQAANGSVTLSPIDADEIISILCKTININNLQTPRRKVTQNIVDLLGSTPESCDMELLHYLTTNYARLEDLHDEACEADQLRTSGLLNKKLQSEISQPICSELLNLLGTSTDWDFNLCQLETLTKSPLRVMTMNCMTKLDLMHKIDFDESKLACFMNEIEKSYPKNPYHNAMHATDIVQATYHFCTVGRLLDATGISHLSTAALIIAAAIHDVNHIGVTNQFLVTTSAQLAIQYNDRSPLENMHLATAFGMMNKQSLNFMERLAPCTQKDIRRLIIAIVLATDNDRHFSLQESLEKVIDQREERNSPINRIITRGNSRLSGTPTSNLN